MRVRNCIIGLIVSLAPMTAFAGKDTQWRKYVILSTGAKVDIPVSIFHQDAGAPEGGTGRRFFTSDRRANLTDTPSFGNSKGGLSRSDYLAGMFACGGTAFCGSIFPSPGLVEGNLGRNTFHGPGFANTDFSVIKNLKIPWFIGGEGANLQFRRSSSTCSTG